MRVRRQSAQPGRNLCSVWGAPTGIHQSEPRLRAATATSAAHWSDLNLLPELQGSLSPHSLVQFVGAGPSVCPNPLRGSGISSALSSANVECRHVFLRPLRVQSHSGAVAALQDESPIPQLRVNVRALHLAFVVIRIPPPPHFATDQTATAVTVLDDVPD